MRGCADNVSAPYKAMAHIGHAREPMTSVHGNGLVLNNTKDGVKIEIRRTAADTAGNTTCYLFVVADALAEFENSDLRGILY
jgi:hypothetical protein